jgi:hypothetical protein
MMEERVCIKSPNSNQFSILWETVKRSFSCFHFSKLMNPMISHHSFWFGVVMIENDFKNCMVSARSEYVKTCCLLFYKVNFITFGIFSTSLLSYENCDLFCPDVNVTCIELN